MKKFFFLFICCVFLFSCEKSIPEPVELELRSSLTENTCTSCEDISVSYTVSQNSECCTYTLKINAVEPCRGGRQHIFINGVLEGYVIDSVRLLDIIVCEEPVTVRVTGFNPITRQWDVVCFEETFECSSCCNGVSAEVIPLGADGDGCCVYDVRMSNPGTCTLYVYNYLNQLVGTINPGTSILRTFELCPEDYTGSISVMYTIRNANNVVCKSFNLTFVCAESCCAGVSYSVTSHGSDIRGCCNYTIDINNGNTCELSFVGPNGTIGTVTAGGNNQFNVSLCPSSWNGVNYEIFKIVADDGSVCKEFKLAYVCAAGSDG